MIPVFDDDGYLPPGEHPADWASIVQRFGGNPRRNWLLGGLRRALEALKFAGCHTAYVDGSFVSAKSEPDDYDGLWAIQDVRGDRLDPVFLDFDHGRMRQKTKYHGEFFPAEMPEGTSGRTFLEFFQRRTDNGASKGIIRINLDTFS